MPELPQLLTSEPPRTQTAAYRRGFRAGGNADKFGPKRADLLAAAAHGARHGGDIDCKFVEQICRDYAEAVAHLNSAEERAHSAEECAHKAEERAHRTEVKVCQLASAQDVEVHVRLEARLRLVERQLAAANGMVTALRERLDLTRRELGDEVAAHGVTAQRANQEHELRLAAEVDLHGVKQLHASDRAALERATKLAHQLSADNVYLWHSRAGTTPAGVRAALNRAALKPAVRSETAAVSSTPTPVVMIDGSGDGIDDRETEVVDVTQLGGWL
jgi:hypothetical protein